MIVLQLFYYYCSLLHPHPGHARGHRFPSIMQSTEERCRMKRLVWAALQPSREDHQMDDFYQGASFSPDSLCLLTSRCNRILLFNTCFSEGDNWKPAVEYKTGDSVRCYQWYPQMQSNNPASCCFLGVSRYVGDVIPRIFVMINLLFCSSYCYRYEQGSTSTFV